MRVGYCYYLSRGIDAEGIGREEEFISDRDAVLLISGSGDSAPSSLGTHTIFAGSAAIAASAEQRIAEIPAFSSARRALLWLGAHSSIALALDDDGLVAREAGFSLGTARLTIPAGSRLGRDGGSLQIESAPGAAIRFMGAPIEGIVTIALAGDASGSLRFSAELAASPLDASIRYFYPDGLLPPAATGLVYPILSGAAARIVADILIDPARPANAGSNYIAPRSADRWRSNLRSVTGGPLEIGVIPGKSRLVSQWDPALNSSYTTLDGDWMISGYSGPAEPLLDVMCGLSGLEYAKVGDGAMIRFVAGAPAYAPDFPAKGVTGGSQPFTAKCPGSAYDVTTSWIYFPPSGPQGLPGASGNPGYYSQPEKGGLFGLGPTGTFLDVVSVQTANFPNNPPPVFGAPSASFPMTPYAGVDAATPSAAGIYQSFEVEMLSPIRGNAIYQMNWPGLKGPAGATPAPCKSGTGPYAPTGPVAVTQQGLYSTFSDDYSTWKRLILASTAGQTVELQCLCTQLRAALLTNQLFLVISDLAALKKCCDVFFPGLAMGGWTFDLATWRPDTVLIIKFADKSLASLVDDISLWSAPNSGFNDGIGTQQVLAQWIQTARDNATQPEFDYFLNTVLKNWNGVIFANCNVPPGNFPPQLAGLAAGIDMSKFSAHHFGINVAPVNILGREIQLADSSLFGLIFYSDPHDLAYQGAPYDYKVLSLRVLFANSDITSFSSSIELLVGELFGERSTLNESAHGDNLILNGVWQRHGTEDSYSFTKIGADTFSVASHVLNNVLITKAQFVTISPPGAKVVATRFLLWGSIRFEKLAELDLFSFGPEPPPLAPGAGGLEFSNLYVSMTFDASAPSQRTFAFQCGQVAFDPSRSVARPQSLYARFPVQATGMVQGDDKSKPANLGYIPLVSPLKAGSLGNPWFGVELALALGSPGGLAAKAGFTATLLASWAPSAENYNAAIGLRLPGSEGGKKSLTIEGPLKLSIGNISLLYNEKEQAYLMRFNNIALSLFSLSFPPGGRTNLLLFGDPDPKGANTTLGWYAAYKKDAGPTGPSGQLAPRHVVGRIAGKALLK